MLISFCSPYFLLLQEDRVQARVEIKVGSLEKAFFKQWKNTHTHTQDYVSNVLLLKDDKLAGGLLSPDLQLGHLAVGA